MPELMRPCAYCGDSVTLTEERQNDLKDVQCTHPDCEEWNLVRSKQAGGSRMIHWLEKKK